MQIDIRELADSDAEASRQLRHEAFGSKKTGEAFVARTAVNWLGAYDGDRLVARFADREYQTCWGGARLTTAGLASVTIAHEDRGSGVLTPLFDEGLRRAKERGAVVATMFPTAVGIYRRLGFERVAEKVNVRLDMRTLLTVRKPDGVTLRRASVADVPTVRALYDDWALRHNGPLVREGHHFRATDRELLDSYTGITIAEDAEGPCGFASWDRSSGHHADSYIAISDLVAVRSRAATALLAMFASNDPVLGFVKLDTSLPDPVQLALPANQWTILERDVYGLKVLDVAAAFEARTWSPALRASVSFALVDDRLAENNGTWQLDVADGRATCRRVSATPGDGLRLTSRGLAVAYAGAQTVASLRAEDLAAGPREDDAVVDALLGGHEVGIRDYF